MVAICHVNVKKRIAWLERDWHFPLKIEGKKIPAHIKAI
jgi:hypothetical protein